MSILLAAFAQPNGTNVDLLNRTVVDSGVGQTRRAGIRVNADGTIDLDDSDTGWTFSYNWITPVSDADTLHQFRITNVNFIDGVSFFVNDFTEDVWRSVTGDPVVQVRDASSTAAGNTSVTFDLEVRFDGGVTLDTCSVSLTAIWDTS